MEHSFFMAVFPWLVSFEHICREFLVVLGNGKGDMFNVNSSFVCFAATVFYYFYLPETKGRTLQEIEDFFSGRTTTLKTKKTPTASNFNINLNEAAKKLRMEKEKLLLA